MFSKSLPKFIILVSLLVFFGCTPHIKDFVSSYQKISQHYDSRIQTYPQDLKLRIELAQFYYNFRDYQKVKELLYGYDAIEAKLILAKTLARLKEYDYAIEIFEQLKTFLPEGPDQGEFLYLYGEVLENKNLFSKAIKAYSKVKGLFQKQAQERIKLIKAKEEEVSPSQILNILSEAKDFLEEVKDEAAITFLIEEKIEITPDNTSLSQVHVIEQVLKERGKELAEVEIGYDSTYERVELEFARTVTKDGKVIYAGKENIRDVSKYLNFPLYSNARAFIVSMPSVEVGSFIEYRIKIYSSKLVNEDDFTFIYRLREKYPIFKALFQLTLPKTREMYFKLFNQDYAQDHNLKPSVKEDGSKKIYKWSFNQIRPLIPEYNMPPIPLVNPAILISSFSQWGEIYEWWYNLFKDKTTLSEETKNFVMSLIEGTSGDFDKAKRIYEYVAKNIRYVAVEYGESGHEPHSAEDVFVNRYGDCKDQAILCLAMLKLAGLNAYPVLIPTRKTYPIDEFFPSLNFNHAICAIEINGELIFIDPTAETTSFLNLPLSCQERPVMVFFNDTWSITQTPQIKDNEVIYQMEIALSEEENAIIKRCVTTKGFFTSSHRWYLKYTHPSKIKEDIQKKMVEISSFSRLLSYEIKNVDDFDKAPVLEYRFTTEKFLNPARDLRIVPVLDEMRLDYNLIGKEERDFPVDFDGVYSKRAEITITLPGNLRVKYLPESAHLENDWFIFQSFYEVSGDKLTFFQEFVIKERFVAKKVYKDFKKELEKVLYLLREEVILARVN